jgi:hypothetical protein
VILDKLLQGRPSAEMTFAKMTDAVSISEPTSITKKEEWLSEIKDSIDRYFTKLVKESIFINRIYYNDDFTKIIVYVSQTKFDETEMENISSNIRFMVSMYHSIAETDNALELNVILDSDSG